MASVHNGLRCITNWSSCGPLNACPRWTLMKTCNSELRGQMGSSSKTIFDVSMVTRMKLHNRNENSRTTHP